MVGRGRADPLPQQSRAGRRHGEIDDGKQRPLARAGERPRDFEIGSGRGVDVERLAVALAQGPRQRRALGLLRALDVEDGAGASGCFGRRQRAKTLQRRDAVELHQPALGGGALAGVAAERQRREGVWTGGIEQRLLGDGAGGDEPRHVAPHDGFGAALFRLGRVFELFADRDAMAERDQLLQIVIGALDRHAAHWNVLAAMLAALR